MQKIPALLQHLVLGSSLLCGNLLSASASVSASPNASDYPAAVKGSLPASCQADPNWFSKPALPQEVKKSGADGSSNFCDFYQFSWQAFTYLMAPTAKDATLRNFTDQQQFPELEVNADGNAANSCDDVHQSFSFFVRASKPQDGDTPFLLPQRIGQAGSHATIYDQNGNVVYYDVRFSRNLCAVEKIKQLQNFPGGTTELKTAWKVLGAADDASKYLTIDAKIGEQPGTSRLGMVGFHLAVATPDHPEFVWATFEHRSNAPDSDKPERSSGWSFTSAACSLALQKGDQTGIKNCQFNSPTKQQSLTGKPTEICRVYPDGSAPTDLKYTENVAAIDALNQGVQPYLQGPYAVLANYINVGALWVSNPALSSDFPSGPGDQQSQNPLNNQRGSLRLANTVAETDFQQVDFTSQFVSNCFGCHNFAGTGDASKGKNTTSGKLSHIFDDIAIGVGQCLDVQTKVIANNQADASSQCPAACTSASKALKWNGQWTNTSAQTGQQLPMTVCGCCGG